MDKEPLNIRELARKLGGDDLVKVVDRESTMQKTLTKKLWDLHTQAVEEADPSDELLVNVAMVEALSTAYAAAACILGRMQKIDHGELLTLAIRSLVSNLERVRETVDANENNVEDMIKQAAKRAKTEE